MDIGRLRHRVTIQNFTPTKLPSGQEKETWQDVVTVWAEVKGISGREMVSSGSVLAEATIRVWIRHRNDVTAASRLICRKGPFAGQVLSISAPPISDAKGRQLEILCKQGVRK